MKRILIILCLCCTGLLYAQVDFNTLEDNSWVQLQPTGDHPGQGGDVHWAMDTAGYAYMFGGCTYYHNAGGGHNNDIYRFNLKTGHTDKLASCSNNRWGWRGGCQAGQTYDINRNCVWVSGGLQPTCSGQGGLWKFQCPDGPMVRVSDGNNIYICYDPKNDLIFAPTDYELRIYNCKTSQWSTINTPYIGITTSAVPCCVDSKRGLFVITLAGRYTVENPATDIFHDIWFYNGATGQWHKKAPAVKPQFYKKELAYDPLNDKYVYFGQGSDGCISEVWAYDYDSNTWTQSARNGRSYNDANKAASTWPPARHKHTWEYSPKYKVFATWGGGQWVNNQSCTDYADAYQPIWIYRLQGTPTTVTMPRLDRRTGAGLLNRPNPFTASTVFSGWYGKITDAGIYNLAGQCIFRFDMAGQAGKLLTWHGRDNNGKRAEAGIYFIRVSHDHGLLKKKITLLK